LQSIAGGSAFPLPPRAYWNKLHAGKKVFKAQLRPRDLATINEVEMSGELSPELLARISTRSQADYPIYLTRADIDAAAMAVPGGSRILKKSRAKISNNNHFCAAFMTQNEHATDANQCIVRSHFIILIGRTDRNKLQVL
jgi:hypothetical protein